MIYIFQFLLLIKHFFKINTFREGLHKIMDKQNIILTLFKNLRLFQKHRLYLYLPEHKSLLFFRKNLFLTRD